MRWFQKIVIFLLPFTLIACVEAIQLDSKIDVSNSLVVEGGITTEMKAHAVKLSRTQRAIGTSTPNPVEGAIVSIVSDSETFNLIEVDKGIYSTDDNVRAEVGRKYTLRVSVQGQTYEATDSVVKVINQQPIEIEEISPLDNAPNGNTQYFQFYFRDNFGAAAPLRYQVQTTISPEVTSYYPLDWNIPDWVNFRLELKDTLVADSTYYLNPGLEPPAILAYGRTNFAELLYGSKVIETFYSMSEQHYEFVRAMLSETDWKSLGPFGYLEANVPTNLSNGAVGFFYASDVLTLQQKIMN